MSAYNEQLEDPAAVEAAYDEFAAAVGDDVGDDLATAVDTLADLPYKHPEQGTSTSIGVVLGAIDRATRRHDLDPDVERAAGRVVRVLDDEYGSYPATGTRRHYSLNARRQNL